MLRILSLVLTLLLLAGCVVFFGWLIVRGIRRSEDPSKLLFKWILTFVLGGLFFLGVVREVGYNVGGAFVVPFVCIALGVVMSILWAPHLGALLARPLTSLFDGGDEDWRPEPLYSIAVAQRKRGKYPEAIAAVHKQLERFPNDYQGHMLLAEIQSEDLKDLAAGQMTIERMLHQPGHTPGNVVSALNLLADWQLKYRQDPEAARQCLERITAMFPNTQEAQMAEQRIAHLASQEMLLDAIHREPIKLRAGVDNVGLLSETAALRPQQEDFAATAAEYVAHLNNYPLDAEVREKLALLYADYYQRHDLAVEQLKELIEQPNQPPKQVVRWLNLMADLQIKQLRDYDSARHTLQRIIELYPTWSVADTARQRLNHLRLELKSTEKTEEIKLGVYEQNIGLKNGPPQILGGRPKMNSNSGGSAAESDAKGGKGASS